MGSRTIVLAIGGRLDRADIPGLCEHARILVECSGAGLVTCDVGGLDDADAVTVDALARLVLTVRRLGREVRLRDPSLELQDLLALVGLDDVVGTGTG